MTSGDKRIDGGGRGTPVVTIRAATLEDLPSLGRLGTLLVQQHHDFDGARFIPAAPQTPVMYAKFLGSQIGNPDAVMLVAECDGEIVGYTYGGLEGFDYMSLRSPAGVGYDLIVDPAHRGLGAGRALLDALLAAFSARGAVQVVLMTAEKNDFAQRMFGAAGFRRTMVEMTLELPLRIKDGTLPNG